MYIENKIVPEKIFETIISYYNDVAKLNFIKVEKGIPLTLIQYRSEICDVKILNLTYNKTNGIMGAFINSPDKLEYSEGNFVQDVPDISLINKIDILVQNCIDGAKYFGLSVNKDWYNYLQQSVNAETQNE